MTDNAYMILLALIVAVAVAIVVVAALTTWLVLGALVLPLVWFLIWRDQ